MALNQICMTSVWVDALHQILAKPMESRAMVFQMERWKHQEGI